jgi:microcystin-dependent protein
MDPFIAEIRMFGCNFAPRGWAQCNGQILAIAQNTALFSLLGTTYGGNGQTTFALPNLQGRAPIHTGQGPGLPNYDLGQQSGVQSVTLLQSEMPIHNHQAMASNTDGVEASPVANVWAGPGADRDLHWYSPTGGGTATMHPNSIGIAGGSQPHNNMQPYLVVTYCIAVEGVFPSRN